RVAPREPFELDELKQLPHAPLDLGLRPFPDLEAERDVLLDRQVLERRVVLEDEADAALLRPVVRDVLLGDLDLAAVGGLEAGDDPEQRRLAAAARPEECRQRSRLDLERDVVEREEVSE